MSGITTVRALFDFFGTPERTVADAVDLLARGGVTSAGAFVEFGADGLAVIDLTIASRNRDRVDRILAESLV